MAQRIKIRRDTKENWEKYNPILSLGEQGYETDTKQFKIGDGETAWNSLAYYRGFFSEDLQQKLENIAKNAEANIINSISVNNVNVAPDAAKNVNIDISGKVDKVTGKGLSTNDYTTDEKNKLKAVESEAQVNKIEKIFVNGLEQTIKEDKSVNIMVENTTVYGIKRSLSSNSASTWERTDDAVGLVANACKNGEVGENDFDSIYPWSDIISYNYDTATKQRVADYGDSNFAFDGSNGEVLTYIPEFYYKRYVEDNYEYIKISKYAIDGFIKSPAFSVGRYESSYDGTSIHSKNDTFPAVSRNITSFRTLSKALGTGFGQLDYRHFILQMLYLVEYANYNSQAVLGNGETGYRMNDNDKALVAESSVNRIIVSTSVAAYFDVGQVIGIGNASAWNNNVAANRIITSKEDYSVGSVTGIAINFAGDAITTTTSSVIHHLGQKSGKCDSLGMKSGCLNSASKNGIIYRGIENIFGNVWKFVDGININDYEAYVCYDPDQYKVDTFTEPYKKVGYALFQPAEGATSTNREGYAKALGYDEANPLVSLTTEVGGSDSTYMCDYAYINSGKRIAFVGGRCNNTSSAGLWCWGMNNASSATNFNVGSRLLLNQN